MAKDFLKADPIGDFEQQFNQDYNQLIRKVHKGLSTKKRSPVYTGFFASSWKAQTMGVRAKDKVENYKPWSDIKKSVAFTKVIIKTQCTFVHLYLQQINL